MTLQRAAEGGQRGLTQETDRGRLALWVMLPGFLIFQSSGERKRWSG